MANFAIRVENLGKRYRIGAAEQRATTAREVIIRLATAPARNLARLRRLSSFDDAEASDTIWALRDVSFELKHGEVLGIIGHNGAGKSTLLKLLSRITKPSTGCMEMYGRAGSLLEVGTGFHPELTGRDNIYLNGSILGMDKRYIDRRFDEIVEFSGVEKFIDTPVKRYSSGMYLRLAFAVAAHLEPEILIVDEVLAVGDASFQKKCLGKMGAVAGEGRTVLFVSHNLDAVQKLCPRSILLDAGRLAAHGDTRELLSRYLTDLTLESRPGEWLDAVHLPRVGSGEVRFSAVKYSSPDNFNGGFAYPEGPLEFMLLLESDAERTVDSLAVTLSTRGGTRLVNANTVLQGKSVSLRPGANLVRLRIHALHLHPDTYQVTLWAADPQRIRAGHPPFDYVETAFDLKVVNPRPHLDDLPPNAAVTCGFEVVECDQALVEHELAQHRALPV